ncbi:MAG: hypothetical protein FWD64_01185, partial [Acidobacteriaceae bacterium]|nr:hypothetical protein [Acidobacteriaceae bacterium]
MLVPEPIPQATVGGSPYGPYTLTVKSLAASQQITGYGDVPLSYGEIQEFTVDPGTCTVGLVMNVGDTCDLSVTFTPEWVGLRQVPFNIQTSTGPAANGTFPGGYNI